FESVQYEDAAISVLSFLRRSSGGRVVLVVCNFTPVPRDALRVGVPAPGFWRERLNSDAVEYGGSGLGNLGGLHAEVVPTHAEVVPTHAEVVPPHGRPWTLTMVAPPLSCVYFVREPG
ncbi:MAG: alpha amylase C-terminal domain-containing protein, partial [Actinomycetota bacterium]|nr:alpha amylase C-terminal domain-containing protein [Actinomycetota bacterium]